MECEPPIIVVSGLEFEARLARGKSVRAIYGLNPSRLLQDVEQAIKSGASGMVSFGTAAGLSPSLPAGTIVIGSKVHTTEQTFTTDPAWASALARQLPDAISANIAGVDSAIASIEEKASLHKETGAVAADMESHRIGQLAQSHNLPFAVLRVVLDDAHTALPPAALAAATPKGNINYFRLLASLLAHPGQMGALVHLAGASAKAKKSLLRCGICLKPNAAGFRSY